LRVFSGKREQQFDDPGTVRSTIDIVAQKHYTVFGSGADLAEETLKRCKTAVDIADSQQPSLSTRRTVHN